MAVDDKLAWLDVAAYDTGTADWGPQQWGEAILMRVYCAQIGSAQLWQRIKADPTGAARSGVERGTSARACLVESLTVRQMQTLTRAIELTADDHARETYGLPHDPRLDVSFDTVTSYAESGMAHVAVDLLAPTQDIKRDFTKWLKLAREKHKALSNIERDMRNWHNNRLLAFADCKLFQAIENSAVCDIEVAKLLIRSNQQNSNDWLRKTAAQLHRKVFREGVALSLLDQGT